MSDFESGAFSRALPPLRVFIHSDIKACQVPDTLPSRLAKCRILFSPQPAYRQIHVSCNAKSDDGTGEGESPLAVDEAACSGSVSPPRHSTTRRILCFASCAPFICAYNSDASRKGCCN